MIYFISDIHLGFFERERDKKREDLFLQLLDRIALDSEVIYLVGDIFDYWFDYNRVIPKEFYRTLTKLHDLVKMGKKIEYIMGNHDFGHKSFFKEELGINIHLNDIERTHFNRKFYLSHGDGKSLNDTGYKILKKILRAKLSLKIYLKLHPDLGIRLASTSSKKSRNYTDSKDFGESDGMFLFAKEKIDKGFDFVIMGHRHKAEITEYKSGKYINLGEWFKKPTFARFDGNDIELLNVSKFLGLDNG